MAWQLLIPLLIVLVLARSRNVLVELKRRGLWDSRFGSAKPSRKLCILGGLLFIVGYAAFFVCLLSSAMLAAAAQKEVQQSQSFLKSVTAKEKAFLDAMQSIARPDETAAIRNAMEKLDALDGTVASWKSKTSADSPLFSIITKYGDAVRAWRDGVAEFGASSPDIERARDRLAVGDKLANEAAAEFNHRYVRPK